MSTQCNHRGPGSCSHHPCHQVSEKDQCPSEKTQDHTQALWTPPFIVLSLPVQKGRSEESADGTLEVLDLRPNFALSASHPGYCNLKRERKRERSGILTRTRIPSQLHSLPPSLHLPKALPSLCNLGLPLNLETVSQNRPSSV